MRITSHILWTACGQQKSQKKMRRGSCAVPCRGSRNTFTVRNGHCPGGDSGTWEEQGNLSLTRVPGSGGRRVRAGKARRLADLGCGEARRGPLHLIHGGDLVLFCPAQALSPGPTRRQALARRPQARPELTAQRPHRDRPGGDAAGPGCIRPAAPRSTHRRVSAADQTGQASLR